MSPPTLCTQFDRRRRAKRTSFGCGPLAVALIMGSSCLASSAAAHEPGAPTSPTQVEPADAPVTGKAAEPTAPAGEVPAVPNPSSMVLGGSPLSEQNSGPPLAWKWSRFSTAEYVLTGAGGAITLATAIVRPRSVHALSGGILFDDAARNALRSGDLQTRYDYRDASDVGLSLAVTWPFFADALVTAWWYRGSRDVAQEMALIDLETLAISGAVQGATNMLVSRERPYGRDCGSAQLPDTTLDCDGSTRYRSFFSGHSSFSFASAALICVHHFENELLGSPWDDLSCAGGYAVAASTSTFRIVGDVHYASDVISGALIGTIIGYGVPLLHYQHRDLGAITAAGMKMQLIPTANGAIVLGVF